MLAAVGKVNGVFAAGRGLMGGGGVSGRGVRAGGDGPAGWLQCAIDENGAGSKAGGCERLYLQHCCRWLTPV